MTNATQKRDESKARRDEVYNEMKAKVREAFLRSLDIPNARKPRRAIEPRLLRREAAAAYMGVSDGTFDRLVKEGKLPAPKLLDKIKIWDRDDLNSRADELNYDGAAAPDDSWSD